MKNEVFVSVAIAVGLATFSIPSMAHAAVGVSPAAAVHTVAVSEQDDHEVSFMRDPVDTETTMRVTVSSSDAFLVSEGVTYMMYPGDREIKIPYRVDTESYATGTYDGYIYIEPERIEDVPVVGNAVKIRGGVRVSLTVEENSSTTPPKTWSDVFTSNLIQNLQIAKVRGWETIQDLRSTVVELVR